MAYIIKRIKSPDWKSIDKAYIESYVWGKEYTPVAFAQICLLEGKGIFVKMTAEEKNPKAVMTQYNDYVCKDSCLEFFAAFDNKSPYYINFETNANGVYMCAYRPGRKDKRPIHEIIDPERIKVKATVGETEWSVEYLLSFDVIYDIFGKIDFKSGYTFKGNLYKCGDETSVPHYGSYYPINVPQPDFHRPEFFGDFIIE